jgi:hypothetical protein
VKRLGDLLARWRGRLDEDTLDKAERERGETPAERRLEEEDFEGRKDDTHVEEYFPGVHDEDL